MNNIMTIVLARVLILFLLIGNQSNLNQIKLIRKLKNKKQNPKPNFDILLFLNEFFNDISSENFCTRVYFFLFFFCEY